MPAHLRYLVRVLIVLLAIGALFRLLLWGAASEVWVTGGSDRGDVARAFLIGLRFDTTVACYLLAPPFLLLSVTRFAGVRKPWPFVASRVFLALVLVPVLLIMAADIPWFLHTYSRFSVTALQWSDDARFALGMIAAEGSFTRYLLPFIGAYALAMLGIRTLPVNGIAAHRRWHEVAYLVLGGLSLLAGIRGRLDEKAPIQPGLAYFGEDPFLNQLGLNPVFTFGTSIEKRLSAARTGVRLMEPATALRMVSDDLGADTSFTGSPTIRHVVPESPIDSLNVVIILMESMSAFKTGAYGGPTGLTPFLNALRPVSLDCEYAYSAGIHTYNGIYSTLYSFPALFDQQPLEDWLDKRHNGLAGILKAHGWSTLFCTTHDPEFDNTRGFLSSHGFQRVISEDDYPQRWVASTNGVPDHRMFEFAMPVLNALARKGPFLSVFMTTSDHKPYILPDSLWFTPRSTKLEDRIVEYADRSVERFLTLASEQDWYDRTVFVILGDHGINMGHTYDMPLSFHHTPLIFHTPGGQVTPGRITSPCGQIDVAPTLLGMLNIPWTNTTMGIDLLRHGRPCMYFCADDRIGCIDGEHYLIHRSSGPETLYAWRDLGTRDLSAELPDKTRALRDYAFCMMQATQWMVTHDLLAGPNATTPRP